MLIVWIVWQTSKITNWLRPCMAKKSVQTYPQAFPLLATTSQQEMPEQNVFVCWPVLSDLG